MTDAPSRTDTLLASRGCDDTLIAGASSAGEALTLAVPGSAPGADPRAPRLTRGETLGRYLIIDIIGSGGMGQVYAAFDPELDRKVAIKLLHLAHTGTRAEQDAMRLVREAQAMARVVHPNVITVHDVGRVGTAVFLAMEFLDGGTLRDWLGERRAWREVLDVFVKAGAGLAAAHRAGLIHRDFKPDNVLLGADGRVVVADFGLARLADVPARSAEVARRETTGDPPASPPGPSAQPPAGGRALSSRLTRTGAALGTPAYMAPEQYLSDEVDARTDQFAFCVALYEALYHQRPFAGESVAALAFQVSQGKLRDPPRGHGVPAHLTRLVRRGLAPRREDRFPTMNDLLAELRRDPRQTRRKWWIAAAGFGLLAGVGATMMAQRSHDPPCEGGRAAIAQVWGPPARESLHGAFAALGAPWAAFSDRRVQEALDEYGRAWADGHRDACAQTRVYEVQSERLLDLRMACLSDRKAAFGALVELLIKGERDTLRRAIDLVDELPSVEACSDITALTARVPPPEDPEVRREVEALSQDLERARQLWGAEKVEEARTAAQTIEARAAALGALPLRARALNLLGRIARTNDRPRSVRLLTQAIDAAIRGKDDSVVVSAAGSLIRTLTGYRDRAYDRETDLWMEIGQATAARVNADPDLRSGLLIDYAQALLAREDFDGSEALFEEALAMRRARHGDDAREVAPVLRGLALVAFRRGQYEAAASHTRKALSILERHYGPDHPKLRGALSNLAMFELLQGRAQAAERPLERLLALRVESYGADSTEAADAMSNLGITRVSLGRYEEAEHLLRRALEIYQAKPGYAPLDIAEAKINLATPLDAMGRDEEALALLQQAVATFEATKDPPSDHFGRALVALAKSLRRAGRLDEAHARVEQGIARIERAAAGEESRHLWEGRLERARIDIDAGHPKVAERDMKALLPAIDGQEDPASRANLRLVLALAAAARGEPRRARVLADEGLAILRQREFQDDRLRRELLEVRGAAPGPP